MLISNLISEFCPLVLLLFYSDACSSFYVKVRSKCELVNSNPSLIHFSLFSPVFRAKILPVTDCARLLSSPSGRYASCLVLIADKRGLGQFRLKNCSLYSISNSSALFQQKRWFKADRNKPVDGERKVYGIGGLSRKEERSLLKKLLDETLNLKRNKETIPSIEQSNEKFRQIIRDENLTTDEVQRLQVIFN